MPGAGSIPYAAMPTRTRSKRASGTTSAPAELARCRSRVEPRRPRLLVRPLERRKLDRYGWVPGLVRCGKV